MDIIKFKNGICYNTDCMKLMKKMKDDSVNLTLTDIPYDGVNRKSNGLRNLYKGKADILTFDLHSFLDEVYRVTKGTIISKEDNVTYFTEGTVFDRKPNEVVKAEYKQTYYTRRKKNGIVIEKL